jgi:hypothetical protein
MTIRNLSGKGIRAAAVALTLWFASGTMVASGQTQKKTAAPKPPVVRNVPKNVPRNPSPKSAPDTLDKLSRLSPEERQRALAQLPPQRRQNIEKRLQDFDKMPPAQQDRVRERLEKLNALTPSRRAEVRKSMQDFAALPQPRKAELNREARRIASMEPEARERYLASPGFKERFADSDRRIVTDLAEVIPTGQAVAK